MSTSRVFLIDGSSQMYRAYHAMRGGGLSGPDGRSTNAVYIFVTMLRKLIQDHQPEYIAASFDLAGRTFRDDLASDYKANRAPMPSGPRRADSVGPRRLRSARRPDPHLRAVRGRRRHRHAGGEGRGRRVRGRDRDRRQGFLPARDDGIRSTTRRRTARGSTPRACRRSSASPPTRWSTCSR